jgi:predicted anti-sigma-YlaC factor YlaD
MSAAMDGEASGVAEELVEAHVVRCAECQAWREAATAATRRVRLTSFAPPPDTYQRIVLATRPQGRRVIITRLRAGLLLLCAAGQVAISIPDLSGSGAGMDDHGLHDMAAFGFALAAAFTLGVLRPRLAAGLTWVSGTAAAGLLITAASDVIGHRTFEAHEAQHLIAIVGAVLLCWVARDQRDPAPRDLGALHRTRGGLPTLRQLRSTTKDAWIDSDGASARARRSGDAA